MTHTKRLAPLAAALGLALAAACGSGGGNSSTDAIVDQVREIDPNTSSDDIAVDYEYMKEQAPDATDDQIAVWIIEVVEWNNCLETTPTGEGCTEISDDNPRGW